MSGNPITQQVAERALKKLGAVESTRAGAHPKYLISHGGKKLVATGLRHSPKPDMGVPHIKKALMVSPQFVLGLANCTKYKDDWLKAIGET